MDEISIQAGRDDSEVGVEMVLKGLWKVDGEIVVEGECPVSFVYSLEMGDWLMIGMQERYSWRIWTTWETDRWGNASHSGHRGRVMGGHLASEYWL